MNYTKSEWRASHPLDGQTTLLNNERLICVLEWGASIREDSQRANANLIAAAPDMYEALKAITFQFAVAVDDARSKDKEIYEQAEQALAKAEGKEVK